MKKIILLLGVALLLTGCGGTTGNQFLAEMSEDKAASFLIKGQTTASQVKSAYGDPANIDMRSDGAEVWSYEFVDRQVKAVSFVPIVSLFYSGTDDKIVRLKVLFDSKGIVEKYIFSRSLGETKEGLAQ